MKKYDGLFRGSPNLARFGLSGAILKKARGSKMWEDESHIFTMTALSDPEKGGVEFQVIMMEERVPRNRHYATVNFEDLEPVPEDEATILEIMIL